MGSDQGLCCFRAPFAGKVARISHPDQYLASVAREARKLAELTTGVTSEWITSIKTYDRSNPDVPLQTIADKLEQIAEAHRESL